MSSERQILKRLLEGNYEDNVRDEELDERTYTVGDTQYWKRGGKCYKWTEGGGRQECSEDDYMKAISGGKDEAPKPTEPSKDASKVPPEDNKKSGPKLTSNFDKDFMRALSDSGVGPMNHKPGDKFKSSTGVDASIKGFYVDMLGKPKVRLEYEDNGKKETLDYFADDFKKDVASGVFVKEE